MSPKITGTDVCSLSSAVFDLVPRDHHKCKSRWKYPSWFRIQQTDVLEKIILQGHHNLAKFSRYSRSSGTPYRKPCIPETSTYTPMYTQPSTFSPGRKKALLIGINYKGQRHELRGCNNDIRNIFPWLINQWGYRPCDIIQLTDDGRNPLPTRHNILDRMHRLASDARAGDSMFLHFSGHGSQIRDLDGDEVDGYDEVICPVDFEESGVITDDEIHEIMVKPLAAGSRLTALFDSCHSGTVLDLPYIYDSRERKFVHGVAPGARNRKQSQAQVVCFSGCGDSEESESVTLPGQSIGGLMTFAFIHVFDRKQTLTFQSGFEQICAFVRAALPDANQQPQYSCSNPLDSSLPFYI
ncbi:caspase domain-containing protein [Suillus ampliporus]|nr:caspase domain-containing protein [Suillus ampliporus]